MNLRYPSILIHPIHPIPPHPSHPAPSIPSHPIRASVRPSLFSLSFPSSLVSILSFSPSFHPSTHLSIHFNYTFIVCLSSYFFSQSFSSLETTTKRAEKQSYCRPAWFSAAKRRSKRYRIANYVHWSKTWHCLEGKSTVTTPFIPPAFILCGFYFVLF